MTEDVVLSSEQELASDKFCQWYSSFPNVRRPYFVVQGYAGTGKSFFISHVLKKLELTPKYMAYTGKAALVLQQYSGVDAATIHSTIYRLVSVSEDRMKKLYAKLEKLMEKPEETTSDTEERAAIRAEIEELKKPHFELNPDAFDDDTPDVLVLDECSMVDEQILEDLLTFGIPIIALGDPGQLPPVKGEGVLFKGMPDAHLTEIRRQALDNPGIQWSMWARNKRQLPATDKDTMLTDPVAKIPLALLNNAEKRILAEQHDIMICWKNATRQRLNQWRRRTLGFAKNNEVFPEVGETLQITKNDKGLNLFNGMFCTVVEVGDLHDHYIEVKVRTELMDEDDKPVKLNLFRYTFESYNDPTVMEGVRPWFYKGTQQADFGYAITCHKAQGSQWARVLIFDENVFNWYKGDAQDKRAQWIYTAITRFVEKVTIISGKI